VTRENFLIECPDCGRQVAFQGRCPKCNGDSWVPAGARVEANPEPEVMPDEVMGIPV
jgi:primosomal protein N'